MHSAKQALQLVGECGCSTQKKAAVAADVIKAARKWSDRRKSTKDKILGVDLKTLEDLAELDIGDEDGGGSNNAAEKGEPGKKNRFVRNRRNRGSIHQVC